MQTVLSKTRLRHSVLYRYLLIWRPASLAMHVVHLVLYPPNGTVDDAANLITDTDAGSCQNTKGLDTAHGFFMGSDKQ
jgi:hypothetical protein